MYIHDMEQLCFLNDFPDSAEERLYKVVAKDVRGGYQVFWGGTYVFVKNTKGLTVRFTGSDIVDNSINPEKIETWLSRLQQKHPNF